MTLEQVGHALGKRHTTVGRWEKGEMKLSTQDLESLASLYAATPSQLLAPPASAEMVELLDRVQSILSGMDADTRSQWLALGDKLTRR